MKINKNHLRHDIFFATKEKPDTESTKLSLSRLIKHSKILPSKTKDLNTCQIKVLKESIPLCQKFFDSKNKRN